MAATDLALLAFVGPALAGLVFFFFFDSHVYIPAVRLTTLLLHLIRRAGSLR